MLLFSSSTSDIVSFSSTKTVMIWLPVSSGIQDIEARTVSPGAMVSIVVDPIRFSGATKLRDAL